MPPRLIPVDHDPWARNPNVQPVLFSGEQGATNIGPGPQGPADVAAARTMAEQGKNSNEIFQSTGWYRGPDGKWKWILSDKNAELNPSAITPSLRGTKLGHINFPEDGSPLRLKDILTHDDLYRAYPDLAETRVYPLQRDAYGTLAQYDPNWRTIKLNNTAGSTREEMTRSILHELQHGIQQREGFGVSRAGGGVETHLPGNFESRRTAAYDDLDKFNKEVLSRLPNAGAVREALLSKLNGDKLNENEQAALGIAEKTLGSETYNKYVDAASRYHELGTTWQKAYNAYRDQTHETEAFQTGWQHENKNWNVMPRDIPGFAPPEEQTIDRQNWFRGQTTGRSYPQQQFQALPTAQAPSFDPWDSGRSMAPADIAPLTDVSQGVRDYAHDVVTGEMARRGLEYYNQHPGEAALALSGGGLSVKGAGPNVIPLSRPRTYEAAQGDARAAIAEPRGYALDIGPKGAEMAPFGDVPAHAMSQPQPQPGPPPRPGEALPEGTALKPLESTNTNAPTYPIAGGYRLMPAFTKKDQWSIIDPRGEIMFRSPDKATAQTVFDYVNKGTTGLAVGGLAAGGALTSAPAEASQNYLQVIDRPVPTPYPKDVTDFYDEVRNNDKYRYEEVHDDPFNRPPQYVPVQYNPYAAAMEDIQPQGIPTASWSFGDTQAPPLVEPSRFPGFSDIDALNYYRPMSNLNGVPTYGG